MVNIYCLILEVAICPANEQTYHGAIPCTCITMSFNNDMKSKGYIFVLIQTTFCHRNNVLSKLSPGSVFMNADRKTFPCRWSSLFSGTKYGEFVYLIRATIFKHKEEKIEPLLCEMRLHCFKCRRCEWLLGLPAVKMCFRYTKIMREW